MDIWLYALSSVVVISICGLVPIVCMPRLQKTRYQNDLLQFLIGLAIGTLTADALLHLLPITSRKLASDAAALSTSKSLTNSLTSSTSSPLAGASHLHDDDRHSHHHEHSHNHNNIDINNSTNHHHHHDESFWLSFMALVGIIGFLVLERIMVLLTDICTHKEHTRTPNKVDSELNSSTDPSQVVVVDSHLSHHHQNHHQHQHHHLTNETKSFMFMIITGDGLHNFFDGIAIGVSFGSSLAVGLSTSIAILCHELPHEIGDFAVLIKSGMTIKRAVLYNVLSSVLCLIGAIAGVFIGRIDVEWVSALIAGTFLYISLVDMVPQLDCYPGQPAFKRIKKLMIQLLGISAGVAIMGAIAFYESRLHSLISTRYNN